MSWEDLSERWKNYFIKELHSIAEMSKDEDTKVGAIIIDCENKVVVTKGYNDLPRGVYHFKERNSRPLKYKFTVHAEKNALFNALYRGVSVKGLTMLSTLYSCCPCAGGIIQSGITQFVCPTPDWEYPSLKDDYRHTEAMFKEAGIDVIFEDKLKMEV